MAKSKNKFVICCHQADLNFVISNFTDISASCLKEFELPVDTVVKVRPDEDCTKGRLRTIFNGGYFGDILIKDKRTKTPDRGLH